mgnify:CR=1 FL=1
MRKGAAWDDIAPIYREQLMVWNGKTREVCTAHPGHDDIRQEKVEAGFGLMVGDLGNIRILI